MRIGLVHSFYRSDAPSGENVVVMRQAGALQEAGHEVLLVARHSDEEMKTRLYGLRSALRVATGTGSDPTRELRDFHPDIVHVHNLFPNLGERWLQRWEGPIVTTLHNFRSVCANGYLFRGGATCMACMSGNSLPALRHGCYRDSRLATLPLAVHNAGGVGRNRLISRADRIILLSERSREVFVKAGDGHLSSKLLVIPNGIEDRSVGVPQSPRHWTFVGRLGSEKGVRELVASWSKSEMLHIAGDGPLFEELEAQARPGVVLHGAVAKEGVDDLIRSSWGLIFPSRWLETGGPPLVVAEAAMHGTPVLARVGTSGADFVERTGSGLLYQDESELSDRLREMRSRHDELSSSSRLAYKKELSLDAWVDSLVKVYLAASISDGSLP